MKILVGCFSAFAASWVLTIALRRYAVGRSLLDVPNERSSHKIPTPRGGGASIVAVFLVGLAALRMLGSLDSGEFWALMLGGAAVAAVGYWDDHRPLGPGLRFAVHAFAAILAVALIGGIEQLNFGEFNIYLGWFGTLCAAVGLVWVVNLYNFMDGIDGLAASEAVFISGAIAALSMVFGTGWRPEFLILAAATVGFLAMNWPPARIFLGDVGSGFLGYAIGVMSLARAETAPEWAWACLILLSLFIMDATVTLVRRMLRRERWSQPHRTHAYQWLAQKYSHRAVTLGYMAINMFVLLPAAWAALRWPPFAAPITLACLAGLGFAALKNGAGDPARQISTR